MPGQLSETEQEAFSRMVFNEAYGKFRMAQSEIQPPVLRLLQHRVFEALSADRRTGELKVHHLVIYLNMEAMGKGIAAGAVGGVVGAALADANATPDRQATIASEERRNFEAATGSLEWKRALYDITENRDHQPCYVIYIETELAGRRVLTRSFAKTTAATMTAMLATATDTAIRHHAERVAAR